MSVGDFQGAAGFGRRGRLLEPYLACVENRLRRQDLQPTASGGLLHDSWTVEKAELYFTGSEPDAEPCAMLVTHAAALLEKCEVDVRRLERCDRLSETQLYAAEAELMLDAAVGAALVRETQHTIDCLLAAGEVGEAKRLSRFHHQLRNAVFGIRKRIDRKKRERAAALAAQLLERSTGVVSSRDPSAPRPVRSVLRSTAVDGESPRPPMRPAVRTRGLALALALTGAIWVVAVHLPGAKRSGPPALDLSRLGGVDGVRDVEGRMASAFVVVDDAVWERLDDAGREELVRAFSQRVASRGYRGVHFANEQGRPVARWLERSGVQLLGREEETLVRTASARKRRETR